MNKCPYHPLPDSHNHHQPHNHDHNHDHNNDNNHNHNHNHDHDNRSDNLDPTWIAAHFTPLSTRSACPSGTITCVSFFLDFPVFLTFHFPLFTFCKPS